MHLCCPVCRHWHSIFWTWKVSCCYSWVLETCFTETVRKCLLQFNNLGLWVTSKKNKWKWGNLSWSRLALRPQREVDHQGNSLQLSGTPPPSSLNTGGGDEEWSLMNSWMIWGFNRSWPDVCNWGGEGLVAGCQICAMLCQVVVGRREKFNLIKLY